MNIKEEFCFVNIKAEFLRRELETIMDMTYDKMQFWQAEEDRASNDYEQKSFAENKDYYTNLYKKIWKILYVEEV